MKKLIVALMITACQALFLTAAAEEKSYDLEIYEYNASTDINAFLVMQGCKVDFYAISFDADAMDAQQAQITRSHFTALFNFLVHSENKQKAMETAFDGLDKTFEHLKLPQLTKSLNIFNT